MKTCSLNSFLEELQPWLDKDYIRSAELNENGKFVLQFLDNTQNIYQIDDCNKGQVDKVMADLKAKGIKIVG